MQQFYFNINMKDIHLLKKSMLIINLYSPILSADTSGWQMRRVPLPTIIEYAHIFLRNVEYQSIVYTRTIRPIGHCIIGGPSLFSPQHVCLSYGHRHTAHGPIHTHTHYTD